MEINIEVRVNRNFIEGTRDEMLSRKIDPSDPNSPIFAHIEAITFVSKAKQIPYDTSEEILKFQDRVHPVMPIALIINSWNNYSPEQKKEKAKDKIEMLIHLFASSFGDMQDAEEENGGYEKRTRNIIKGIADQSLNILPKLPSSH